MISKEFRKILQTIYPLLEDFPSPWAVTGSLGFALQGLETAVNDVDLQTDRAGAYEMERRLSLYRVRPVAFSESERIRSHFGELEIRGIKVEVMGDVQKRLPDGRWEDPVEVALHRRWVIWKGMRLPVLSLEYEARAYRIMGRNEKAQMLENWMEEKRRQGK